MVTPTVPDNKAPATERSLRSRLLGIGRIVLLLAVLAAAGWAVTSHWSEVQNTIVHMSWKAWLPAFVALPVAIGLSTLSWQLLLDELGPPIGISRGSQIFLVGQLGKYLPGSVWAYLLQIELGRRAGLARARVFTATLFSLAIGAVAALLCASLALPTLMESDPRLKPLVFLYALLPIALVCLHPRVLNALVRLAFRILRRPTPDHPVRFRAVLGSLLAALGGYLFFGLHLYALAAGTTPLGLDAFLTTTGTMAVGMLAGLFFFILPSGAGVREVVIVAGLSPYVGTGPAIALAAVSRVLLTIADLATAAIAAGVGVYERRVHGPTPHDVGIEDEV